MPLAVQQTQITLKESVGDADRRDPRSAQLGAKTGCSVVTGLVKVDMHPEGLSLRRHCHKPMLSVKYMYIFAIFCAISKYSLINT